MGAKEKRTVDIEISNYRGELLRESLKDLGILLKDLEDEDIEKAHKMQDVYFEIRKFRPKTTHPAPPIYLLDKDKEPDWIEFEKNYGCVYDP